MVDINIVIAALGDTQASVDRKARELEVARSECRDFGERIRRRIEAGEKPDNRYRGMVIRAHARFDRDLEDRYARFEASLAGKKGQLFVVTYLTTALYPMLRSDRMDGNEVHSRVGLLDGDELVWEPSNGIRTGGEYTVPVGKYIQGGPVRSGWNPYSQKPEIVAGDIFEWAKGENVEPFSARMTYSPDSDITTGSRWPGEMIVGDSAVKAWLQKYARNSTEKLFNAALTALGVLVLEP